MDVLDIDRIFFSFSMNEKKRFRHILKEMIIHAFETERHAVACLMQET